MTYPVFSSLSGKQAYTLFARNYPRPFPLDFGHIIGDDLASRRCTSRIGSSATSSPDCHRSISPVLSFLPSVNIYRSLSKQTQTPNLPFVSKYRDISVSLGGGMRRAGRGSPRELCLCMYVAVLARNLWETGDTRLNNIAFRCSVAVQCLQRRRTVAMESGRQRGTTHLSRWVRERLVLAPSTCLQSATRGTTRGTRTGVVQHENVL